jgi:hypothetical protein
MNFDSTLDFNGVTLPGEFELENRDDGSLRVGDALKQEFNTNPTNFSIYQSGSIQMIQGKTTEESEIPPYQDYQDDEQPNYMR